MEGNGSSAGGQQPSEAPRKTEQERVAEAIFNQAEPGSWDTLADSGKEKYMRMAEAAVGAAMPPLPEHQGIADPPYPAELLDLLATELAWKYQNSQQFSEGVREAMDRYEQEVGRENVPPEIAKFIADQLT